jgi:EAL domain-containing protein (putative c-di-GMP-specific phosphodiesterase class I)
VLAALREPITLDEHAFYVDGSIGISSFPEGGAVAEELLRQADQAMYSAKRGGGDQACFFSVDLNEQLLWRQRAESLLRRALDREELAVVYQPIVSLADGRPVGAEALLRWHSAELGVVSPELFIELAETTGQIDRIGTWVLQQAIAAAQSWPALGPEPLWVSVNLSPRQLRGSVFPRQVQQLVRSSGLRAGQLKLEVTEQQLLEDILHMAEHLRALDREGIQLAIDDFGTGYASLAYLRQFPFRILKIDRSFVRDVPYHRDACVLVRTILAMAAELELQVVAEGIETEDQLQFLRRYGCRYGQGFFFSRPRRGEDFSRWLEGFGHSPAHRRS